MDKDLEKNEAVIQEISQYKKINLSRLLAVEAITDIKTQLMRLKRETPMITQQIAECNSMLTWLGDHTINFSKIIEYHKKNMVLNGQGQKINEVQK